MITRTGLSLLLHAVMLLCRFLETITATFPCYTASLDLAHNRVDRMPVNRL